MEIRGTDNIGLHDMGEEIQCQTTESKLGADPLGVVPKFFLVFEASRNGPHREDLLGGQAFRCNVVFHESLQKLLGWLWVMVKPLESLVAGYKDSIGRRRAVKFFHNVIELINKFREDLAMLVLLYLLVDRMMGLVVLEQTVDLVGI